MGCKECGYCDEHSESCPYHPANERVSELEDEIARLQGIIAGFYDAIAHGDEEHREWLRKEVDKYLAGS